MAKRTRVPGLDAPARKGGGRKKRKKVVGLDTSTRAKNRLKNERTKTSKSPGRGKKKAAARKAAKGATVRKRKATAARRAAKKAGGRVSRQTRQEKKATRKRKRF